MIGLVLLTGVAGLTSFGQAAFVGIGAYTAAYLTLTLRRLALAHGLDRPGRHRASPRWCSAWVTLRMSGHYLPLATIAWGLSLFYLLGNLDFLGKYDGLLGIPALVVLRHRAQHRAQLLLPALDASSSSPRSAITHLLDSRAGRALRAVKGGSTMAEAMGVDTFRVKVTAFVLAALLASVSGWLFAHFQRTVNPSPFGLNMGIEYLFMAVLGGVGYVWGALVGAGVVQILKDQLQVCCPS